jgi:carboxymethylenebutenolidase
VADDYAEEGYITLAPDLFWRIEPGLELGYSEADIQKAMGYLQRFDIDESIRDCADCAQNAPGTTRSAPEKSALGFCLGGTLAYLAAARTDIDCAVS